MVCVICSMYRHMARLCPDTLSSYFTELKLPESSGSICGSSGCRVSSGSAPIRGQSERDQRGFARLLCFPCLPALPELFQDGILGLVVRSVLVGQLWTAQVHSNLCSCVLLSDVR